MDTSDHTHLDIKEFMPLVKVIAGEIHRFLPSNVMLEDLIQDGMLGLFKAYRERPVDCELPLRTYLSNQVRWAIQDGLRAADWASRSVRGGMNKINKVTLQLRHDLGKEPSKTEIAVALGLPLEDVFAILSVAQGTQFVRINDTEQEGVFDIPDLTSDPALIVERRQARTLAYDCLSKLKTMERRAYILRELCEISGSEVARELGVSEARISQLCNAVHNKISGTGA